HLPWHVFLVALRARGGRDDRIAPEGDARPAIRRRRVWLAISLPRLRLDRRTGLRTGKSPSGRGILRLRQCASRGDRARFGQPARNALVDGRAASFLQE